MNGMAVPLPGMTRLCPIPVELGLHGLFRQQAERVPWRWSDMKGRRSPMASWTPHQSAGNPTAGAGRPDERPGRFVPWIAGLSLAVGILGILKAGGAYPLDSAHPSARLADMLCDAG